MIYFYLINKMSQMEQTENSPQVNIPAFMTHAGYERALAESIASRDHWIKVGERMKRQQEEQEEEWKRKDTIYAKAMRDTGIESQDSQKIQRDHAEIKKYSQQEIDEAVRQIRIERLKNLLNPYVY
jgi:hypothetical protein